MCESDVECDIWVRALSSSRYSTLVHQKEQLEQKYLHLSAVAESETTAKEQFNKQCDELENEVSRLRIELIAAKKKQNRTAQLQLVLAKSASLVEAVNRERRLLLERSSSRTSDSQADNANRSRTSRAAVTVETGSDESFINLKECRATAEAGEDQLPVNQRKHSKQQVRLELEIDSLLDSSGRKLKLSAGCYLDEAASEELAKIKKVQGFFRGWLCRRRWKQIVQEYIKSPHAESMRKRNNLVFKMVEAEEEYVEQLSLLISSFSRPIKMAASSQRPPLSHDELNSIFLNSETLLFLHQIFLKGLIARMESWPTLVLADLFNMLLPMLTIYQEFVRNHHVSLKVLAECKQREQFSNLLNRLEMKQQLAGRSLETFLTYPMHQVSMNSVALTWADFRSLIKTSGQPN